MTIEPIVLTKYGEALEAYPRTEKRDPTTYKLISCVGVHSVCNGFMDCNETSSTHSALVCRICHLRVVIPKEVDTWAKLQERMKHIPQVKDMSPLREE